MRIVALAESSWCVLADHFLAISEGIHFWQNGNTCVFF